MTSEQSRFKSKQKSIGRKHDAKEVVSIENMIEDFPRVHFFVESVLLEDYF